jgi:hypothetical protein
MMPAKSAIERLARYERVDIATTRFENLFFMVGGLCDVCWWEEVALLSLAKRDISASLVCLVRIVHHLRCIFNLALIRITEGEEGFATQYQAAS